MWAQYRLANMGTVLDNGGQAYVGRIRAGPYWYCMVLGCRILGGLDGPAHMGPISWPRWVRYATHGLATWEIATITFFVQCISRLTVGYHCNCSLVIGE